MAIPDQHCLTMTTAKLNSKSRKGVAMSLMSFSVEAMVCLSMAERFQNHIIT